MHSLLLSLLLLGAQHASPIAVVKTDLDSTAANQSLLVFPPAGSHDDTLGNPVTSDLSFAKGDGPTPTVFVFAADPDGDKADQVILVRAKKTNGDLQVRVFDPPFLLGSDVGSPLGTSLKKTLGNIAGDEPVVLVGGGDFDGDGKDEAFVVRTLVTGVQALEVRKLPTKDKHDLSKVLASDLTFGAVGTDENVALCGLNADSDKKDEIAVLRRSTGGEDRLLVFNAPTAVGGETGDAFLSDLDVTASGTFKNMAIGRLQADDDKKDELVLLQRSPIDGWRLRVVELPSGIDDQISPPVFQDDAVAPHGSGIEIAAAFGLAGYTANPPPPPPATIAGTYQGIFQHTVGTTSETLNQLGTMTMIQAGKLVTLNLPGFNALQGTYTQSKAEIDYIGQIAEIDYSANGATYKLALGIANVAVVNGKVVISGTYVGKKVVALGQELTVKGGTFTLVRN